MPFKGVSSKFNEVLTSTTKVVYARARYGLDFAPFQYTYTDLPKSSLHENVVFSVCAHMGNAAYIIPIMWNSISSLDT